MEHNFRPARRQSSPLGKLSVRTIYVTKETLNLDSDFFFFFFDLFHLGGTPRVRWLASSNAIPSFI